MAIDRSSLPRSNPSSAAASPARVLSSALAFGLAPLFLLVAFTALAIRHNFAFDFRTFWHAARFVLQGNSPYPLPSTVAHVHPAAGDYEYFVYPPPFILLILPLAALPFAAAAAVWMVILVASVAGAFAVLGVRDWRCYGLAFATVPVLSSLRLGAVTPLLMLFAACAWRYRNEPLKAGLAVAAGIMLKVFLWPLLLWLLVTRRTRAALTTLVGVVVFGGVAWAAIGFDGLRQYPTLLRTLGNIEGGESYSLVALADRLHLAEPSQSWAILALPLVLLLATASIRRSSATRDDAAFAAAIGLALLLTPITWLNYFALLAVPIGARRRELGPEWLLLLLFWITPSPEPIAHPLWQVAVPLGLAVISVTWLQPLRPLSRGI